MYNGMEEHVAPLMRTAQRPPQSREAVDAVRWPEPGSLAPSELDAEVARLAVAYQPLACELLREAIRLPKDHVAEDPRCGTSNHEGPRLEYLRRAIVEHGAVADAADCFFDGYGNLVWEVRDPEPPAPGASPPVTVWMEGHTDTVHPLPEEWRRKIGGGIDVYDGLVDETKVDEAFLRSQLGYLPPRDQWAGLIFGRGGADQLSGVVAQIVATKILLELRPLGSLRGRVVRCYGTVAEEDNDGGGPLWVIRHELPGRPEAVPDCVIHTEGTGDAAKGPVGLYIGHRGRVQVEVEVVGVSCHGSMPWEGRNPLEYGSLLVAEAQRQAVSGEAFRRDPFLGDGTRTASWCDVTTPSTCAVPASFRVRFDRRLTVGETPEQAVDEIRSLRAVREAAQHGFEVRVRVPHYRERTWRGVAADNAEQYMGWLTPPDHPAVRAAYEAYLRVVTPGRLGGPDVPARPRVDRWVFSTDGVAYPIHKRDGPAVQPKPLWVDAGEFHHPPMFGIGIGCEQNCHAIGEFVEARHFPAAVATMARFVSVYQGGAAGSAGEEA